MLHWTKGCMHLFEWNFCLDIYLEVELLDPMVIVYLVFYNISILFSIVVVPIYISTSNEGGYPFLHILSSICYFFDVIFWSLTNLISRFVNDGHSDRCEVVPHCSFDLHFCNNCRWWAFFMCLLAVLLWRIVYLGLFADFSFGLFFVVVVELYELFVYFGN